MRVLKAIYITVFAAIFSLALERTVKAQVAIENQDSRPEITEQIEILTAIQPYIESTFQYRIKNLIDVSKETAKIINQKGMVDLTSIQSIQRVVIVHRYSESYFDSIQAELIQPQIKRLKEIVNILAKRHGLNRGQGAHLIEIMLKQMQTLVKQLIVDHEQSKILPEIVNLNGRLGNAIGIAFLGDRPDAFTSANKVYFDIKKLSDTLLNYGISDQSFEHARELIDLNEQYGNYAQIPNYNPLEEGSQGKKP